jgi:S1-C subfamily serine protease
MSALVATLKPGDKVTVNYKREGKDQSTTLTLKSQTGTIGTVTKASALDKLGAEVAELSAKEAGQFEVPGGVTVKKIKDGGILSNTRIQEGFVILTVNSIPVKNVAELEAALNKFDGGTVKLEGIYPGYEGMYAYRIELSK